MPALHILRGFIIGKPNQHLKKLINQTKYMKPNQPTQKIEKNYTKIENDLLNWSVRTNIMSKPERKIFDLVIRQTNGFHKEEAEMSTRFIAVKTGIHHRNVKKYIDRLIRREIISMGFGPKMKYGKPVHKYKINKEYCYLPNTDTGINETTAIVIDGITNKDINIFEKKKKELVDNLTSPTNEQPTND